jgi:ferrochelatase
MGEPRWGNKDKIKILLINLGTPSAPTPKAVRHYLKEFLSDSRVVEIPKYLWLPILYGIILPLRSTKSAKAYQQIWTSAGSPLLAITQQQTQALNSALKKCFNTSNTQVEFAMRYGEPAIANVLEKFRQEQISQLIIFPLYPQYANATTGSVFAEVSRILSTWRYIPELHFINNYATEEIYIDALADSIHAYWNTHGRGEKLLMSFHGLPQKSIEQGDPYFFQCQQTAHLLAEKLKLTDQQWQIVFQSRFGKAKWLQPYCEETIRKLAKNGCKTIDVVCPGFAADCLETLEEISLRYKEIFLKEGGEKFNYIPALNDSEINTKMLATLAKKYL